MQEKEVEGDVCVPEKQDVQRSPSEANFWKFKQDTGHTCLSTKDYLL